MSDAQADATSMLLSIRNLNMMGISSVGERYYEWPLKTHIKGYELKERIGQGGFGEVYRAFQPLISREVAIKVILPEFANQPEFVRRFETEAQIIARLEHLHIVPLYDYWREPDSAYLVMRWLRGGNLRTALTHTWDIRQTATLMNQLISALNVAHQHGVVHSDIKPDNILLDEEDNVYLTDFGIAKDLNQPSQTERREDFVGSLQYVAPEQILGQGVTPQTDIYSLGIVLFELLTGHHPFEDATDHAATLASHLRETPPPIQYFRPDLSSSLDAVIQQASAKKPEHRFGDVLQFAVAFRRAIAHVADGDLPSAQHITRQLDQKVSTTEITDVIALEDVQNPYKGLRAFQEADTVDFFGREELTRQLVNRLKGDDETSRFLAVVGPSGSGKSSVVNAGVLPILRRSNPNLYIVEMVPGAHPIDELTAALLKVATKPLPNLRECLLEDESGLLNVLPDILPDASSEILLVIDQFEEVFTIVESSHNSLHLLSMLVAAVKRPQSRFRLLVTLRADFYDRPLMHPAFSDLMRTCTEVVVPLTPSQLEAAIVKPAQRVGARLEPGLVAAMIAEVVEEPGTLPLLQYALTELFEKRENNTMTLAAYHTIDGALGALARRANELYQALDAQSQAIAQQVFLRLVTLGEGTEDTRRRVTLTDLTQLVTSEADITQIIDLFGKHRLLTFDRDPVYRIPTVEVAHEALLRKWAILRNWLDESRDDIRMQQRLANRAEEWFNADRDPSFLLRGTQLEQARKWVAETTLSLTLPEQTFLDSSITEHDVRLADEKARKAREALLENRNRQRLRIFAAFMTFMALVGIGLAIFAFSQQQTAQAERDKAERRADEIQSLRLASDAQQALDDHNPDLALALAYAAIQIDNPSRQVVRLFSRIASAPGTYRLLPSDQAAVWRVVVTPDDRYVIASTGNPPNLPGPANTIRMWDLQTGTEVRRFQGHTNLALGLAISPDGQFLLSAAYDQTFRVWNIQTGAEIRRFEMQEGETVSRLALSPDGSTFASKSEEGLVRIRDFETGEILLEMEGEKSFSLVGTIAYSSDGKTLLTGTDESGMEWWDLDTGQLKAQLAAVESPIVDAVAFLPNTNLAFSGLANGQIMLWDLEAETIIRRYEGHSAGILSLSVSTDGRTMISASADGSLILWEVDTGAVRYQLYGHNSEVNDVMLLSDGLFAVSVAVTGSVRVWDLGRDLVVQSYHEPEGNGLLGIALSPDGHYLAVGVGNVQLLGQEPASFNGVILWDTQTWQEIRRFTGHTGAVLGIAFNPSGDTLASVSEDGTIRLWDVSTGRQSRQIDPGNGPIYGVVFSPDGQQLLTGGLFTNDAVLWDIATGQEIRRFSGHEAPVLGTAFSPDGQLALSGSFDNTIRVWEVATGRQLLQFNEHSGWVFSVSFTPDGKQVLSGSFDGSLILWDVNTGEVVHRFAGHNSEVQGVTIDQQGELGLSASWDGTAILWDLVSGQPIHRFESSAETIYHTVFSLDGDYVYATASGALLVQWTVPEMQSLDDLIEWTLANRYLYEFSCLERSQYLIEPFCD